jgi:AcrR family transcriptional regulator
MTVTVASSGGEVRADAFGSRTFTPTEERILIAALSLIGRQGVQRLGMAQIADTAGVARGTLYRYFPSRDHVLAAAADYDEARFSAGLDEVLDHVTAPRPVSVRSSPTPSTSSAATRRAASSSPSPGSS